MRFPNTLFSQIVTTIAAVSLAFLLFSLTVIGYFMLVPMGKSSADDLASLMVMSVHHWEERSPVSQAEYEKILVGHYQLRITDAVNELPLAVRDLPYYFFLESSLTHRTGHPIRLMTSQEQDGEQWYWADIPGQQNHLVRIGFPSSHISAKPPLAMIILLIVGTLATLITAATLAHFVATPLERLTRGARHIGTGNKPEPIPETGADELATLAQTFNDMAEQVQELLRNRTTLLAGISHDLRTPMARIQLALEMLPADADPELMAGIRGDLEQMNCLVGQFLELSRGLEKGEQQQIEIGDMLNELVNCARRGGAEMSYRQQAICPVVRNPLALRRIVVNLLENAVRYGGNQEVTVRYHCNLRATTIEIIDQGPGIPADQLEAVFQPFYRLEQSRNTDTGGSGLGLSIAKQLADANNIEIQLKSEPGKGTTAIILLPAPGV
ncbi:MAG: ATP-binding protein [Gammaproteobacteria bacterium]|nr:ATP-binding protein [Gammaproteobacteria bacterium]